jgi:flagellar biosynthesis regulator FlaF
MRQILVPERAHDANVCMQNKQNSVGIWVHKEEEKIRRKDKSTGMMHFLVEQRL